MNTNLFHNLDRVHHLDATINTTDVKLGDILKAKKTFVVTKSGAMTGHVVPIDTVFLSPVAKITKAAIFLANNTWFRVDPSAYIVVDSDTNFLRSIGLTAGNVITTGVSPVTNTVSTIKSSVNSVIDTGKNLISGTTNFLDGLGTYIKWFAIAAAVIVLLVLANKLKENI